MTELAVDTTRELTIGSAGVELAVRESGRSDGRPVVLLHGLTATRDYVVMRSRRLEHAGCRVIAYDVRGHGKSSPPPTPDSYGYELLLADLVAVLDALEVGPAIFVGASLGSHTAVRLAMEQPGRVDAIVAVTPAYDPDSHPDDRAVRRADRLARALREGGVDAFVDEFEFPEAPPRRTAAYRAAVRWQLSHHHRLEPVADALESIMRIKPFESLTTLGTLDAPALVVGSRDEFDHQHRLEVAHKWAAALGAPLVVEEPGRMPLAWSGSALSRTVLDFVASLR